MTMDSLEKIVQEINYKIFCLNSCNVLLEGDGLLSIEGRQRIMIWKENLIKEITSLFAELIVTAIRVDYRDE